MSKAVLMSIQPKGVELIANGKKTIEIRKTKPKLQTPFKCYIYCTKDGYDVSTFGADKTIIWHGKVIGEFVCDKIECFNTHPKDEQTKRISCQSCVEVGLLMEYQFYAPCIYAWHISNLVIYDQPKELSEFWLYNEELHKRYESEEDYCAWGNSTTESGCQTNDCEGTDLLQCYQCWEYWSGWCHKLKKAPQSWCYVEELDND